MIRSTKTMLLFSIKLILVMTCICAIKFLTNSSETLWGRSNWKLIGHTYMQDTIHGKIIDSVTNEPIPFATISFYKGDTKIMTFLSDANGEFSSDMKYVNLKVKISAIGYLEHPFYFANEQTNFVRLAPANNSLPTVTVSSKAKKMPNASKIMQKVNEHITQNYGDFSFDQRFKFYSSTQNYDTTKCNLNGLVDIQYINSQRLLLAPKWHEDKITCDDEFLKFIGLPLLVPGDITPSSDILRKGLAIGEKNRKNYEFKLLAHYQDKIYGGVYLVSFIPKKNFNDLFLAGRTIGGFSWTWRYFKGVILIKQDDFAVVSLKYIWDRPVEGFNTSLEDSYRSPYWKARRGEKIISSSIIYEYEYSYAKDSATGKYFVETIKADCHNSGYQIENHRKLQLHYQIDATSLGIKNIVN